MLGKRERPPFRKTRSISGINVAAEEIPPPFEPRNPMIGGGGFGDVIVGPSGNDEGSMAMMPPEFYMTAGSGDSAAVEVADFLKTCGLCNRSLPPGRDIYMYRGDAAFCSLECREQQIKQDEKKERRAMAKKVDTHHNHSKVAAGAAAASASDTSSKSETVAAA
ncbi:uncharacterized protein LOC111408491 [Olea europaea var. sylvestris]|uniref:uncharacterized protein LOC111408491 n=1 Tax=Olea europaea var. sylvestris TaxID=158386 RepID=UPI000C1D6E26|nr:uncharacterized protein LOC111408491 [Olea europaea var. sylvestris]